LFILVLGFAKRILSRRDINIISAFHGKLKTQSETHKNH